MIQPSALNFVIVACMILIFGFLARSIAARYPDSTFSQAVMYAY